MNAPVKILAINGSHRSEKGFTEIVLKSFLKGAQSANARCEVLYPSGKKITPCDSCGKCLFETPGTCKFRDDMESVIREMETADLIVFSCPVYFDGMPSHMKKMIERLRSTLDAAFEFRNGRTYHLKIRERRQSVVLIFTAGNPERDSFVSIRRVFNRIADNMGWQVKGELDFPASHLLVAEPHRLSGQLEAVTQCGRDIVTLGEIREEILAAANKTYVDSPETTLDHMSRMILQMRRDRREKPAEVQERTHI